MDEVSEFFKSGFLSLHKNAIRKNYQQETLRNRINTFNNIRRETRNTLIFRKRQINENMTPINTPEPTNTVKKIVEKKEEKKTNKRLEMLQKWKMEKEKRKQEEKQKSKPLFKVYHIPVEVGLPNLENVNKKIKGKPISQFAPPNHKFHAPKNLQPIDLNVDSSNNRLLVKSKIAQKVTLQKNIKTVKLQKAVIEPATLPKSIPQEIGVKSDVSKGISKKNTAKSTVHSKIQNKSTIPHKTDLSQESIRLQRNISNPRKKLDSKIQLAVTKGNSKCSPAKRNRKNEKDIKKELSVNLSSAILENVTRSSSKNKEVKGFKSSTPVSTVNNVKNNPEKSKTNVEEITNSKSIKQESTKKNNSEENSIRTPRKSRKSINTSKKSVGWKVIEFVESDDEILSKDLNTGTPQKITKKYNKTPMRSKKTRAISNTDTEVTMKDEDEYVQRSLSAIPKNKNSDMSTKCKELSNSKGIKGKELKEDSVRTPKKSRESNGIPKKNSGWNIIQIVNSDEEVFSKDVPTRTSQRVTKKFHKVTVRNKKPEINDISTEDARNDEDAEIQRDLPDTPKNNMYNDISTSPVYISPFVTVSRGKTSARKEYQVRQSTGSICNTPDFIKSISNNISPKAGADYFSKKLDNQIVTIENICKEWNTYRDENKVPEEVNDLIDVAIGQSKLLISKKFQQFRNLIEQCRNCDYSQKPISCEDLHGFWDMMYMQVQDLNKRFKNLDDLKANNWQEVIPVKKPTIKRGRGRPKKASASSTLKDIIKAARKNKIPNAEENNLQIAQPDEAKVFSGGYYVIKSPVEEQRISTLRPSSARRSLRASLLSNQVRNRISSPGLTMMRVSQAIKCGNGLTPSKSILKNDLTNSTTRKAKSVLFKDDLEEDIGENLKSIKTELCTNTGNDSNKENNASEINLITFSPQTPTRKSQRLRKIN